MSELELAEYRTECKKCLECCGKIHEWVVANVGNIAEKVRIHGSFREDGYVYSWSATTKGLHMSVGAHTISTDWKHDNYVQVGQMWQERNERTHYRVFIGHWADIKAQITKEVEKYKNIRATMENFVA